MNKKSMLFNTPKEDRSLQSYIEEAKAIIKRWGAPWMVNDDDVVANVASAVAKAEYDFDPSRGNKRVTVRVTYGRYAVYNEFRKIKRLDETRPKHFSIDLEHEPVSGGNDFSFDVEDYREPNIPDIERVEALEDRTKYVRGIIRKSKILTNKQKKYLRLRYITGVSQADIAERNSCSKQAVNQVLLHGIRNLKLELLETKN